MKAYSPEFERRLWRRIRARWYRATKRHPGSRPGFWTRCRGPNIGCGTLILAVVPMFVVNSLGSDDWTAEAILALGALFFTWVIVIGRGMAAEAFTRRGDLLPLYCLPASDDLIFAQSWRRMRSFVTSFFIASVALLAAIHPAVHFSFESAARLLVVSALGTAAAAALAIAPLRFPVGRFILLGFVFLLTVAIRTPVVSPAVRDYLTLHGEQINWLHPGGWIVLMANGALPGGPPRGTAVLAVPLLLLVATIPWSRRCWRTRFDSQREMAAFEAAGYFRSRTGSLDEAEFDPDEDDETAAPEPGELSPSDVRAALAAELRAPLPTFGPTALDRRLGPKLSDREAMLVRALRGERAALGQTWKHSCVWLAGVWLLGAIVCAFSAGPIAYFILGVLGPLGALIPFATATPLPQASFWSEFLPIGYLEVVRVSRRFAWRGLLLIAPPLVAYGVATAWLIGQPLAYGASTAFKAVLFLAASHPLVMALHFSGGTRDTSEGRWRNALILGAFVIGLLNTFGGIGAVYVGSPASLPAAIAVLLCTWAVNCGILAFHRRAWSRRWFDVYAPAVPGGG